MSGTCADGRFFLFFDQFLMCFAHIFCKKSFAKKLLKKS